MIDKKQFLAARYESENFQMEATRERSYIIGIQNKYRFYWDLFIIILAVYNAMALPMQIAYAEV